MNAAFLLATAATEWPEPWRRLDFGGATVWVAYPTGAQRARLDSIAHDELRLGLTGQIVLRKWTGVRVDPTARWRPRVDPTTGLLPFSMVNAGLLYLRAETLRDAVNALIAAWDRES